ncbi:MAG: ASKHA domain-containing protein [Candidatus Thorarchaeota archaeon]
MAPVIVFKPSGTRVSVDEETTVLEASRAAGLHLSAECGGRGSCGKCAVIMTPSPEPNARDLEHLSSTQIERGMRLACQHTVVRDTHVIIPHSEGAVKILEEGKTTGDWSIDETQPGQYGVAVDLGTTTVVAYLMDLSKGVQVAHAATLNPQIAFGEDVLSRVQYALTGEDKKRLLQQRVVESIQQMTEQMSAESGVDLKDVTRIAVVGNTVMQHLLLGADVEPLSRAPFEPSVSEGVCIKGKEIGLDGLPAIDVHVAPNIAKFVGGDTLGFILSQRLDRADDLVLGIDIGTNGEIVLSDRGTLYCCSTAAGPALEGATITNGMRGQSGAVEHVEIHADGTPEIAIIGDEPPRGFCGSAIVDIVAEMKTSGIIDKSGRMDSSAPRVVKRDDGQLAYVVVQKGEHGSERNLLFTQKDVRQIQLAKAAIHTGTVILLREKGYSSEDMDRLLLAGAFGTYIRPESALEIGLLPSVQLGRIDAVGNAAGEGAKMLLLSGTARSEVSALARNTHYVDLATHPSFQDTLMASIDFP